MAFITSRKHTPLRQLPRKVGVAGLLTGMTLAAGANAADTTAQVSRAQSLPRITVRANRMADYRVDKASSPKFTQPLLDTPQTVSVITQDLIQQQGATTLTEALHNSPGVGTFYVGENGSTSTGDAIYLRGFDSSGSIFVDGMRDLGSVSRDVFNIEQVEVTKGPDGTEYGRTAPTGAINMVSKQPQRADAAAASVAYGSGQHKRATVDWNRRIGQHAAFRLNLVGQDSGVPGRNRVRNGRWGIAPSLAFGLGTPTRIYLDLLHMRQDNVPDGGVATMGLPGYASPDPSRPFISSAPAVDPENFYGTAQDHDQVTSDLFTAIVEHDFSPNLSLHDTLRWGRTRQDYLLTSFTATATNLVTPDPSDPSSWTLARSKPNFKHQSNRIVANQTNLVARFDSGRLSHTLSTGLELTQEKVATTGMGALGGSSWPAANLYHPQPGAGGLVYGATGAHAHGQTHTAAAYLFDTVKWSDRWQLSLGARLDHYTTGYTSIDLCGGRRGPDCGDRPEGTPLRNVDGHVSGNLPGYKVGLLYKPVAQGSVYANLASSQNPPGGQSLALSNSDHSADNPGMDPQKARTVELGTKWDLLDQRLLLSGALYRTTVSNELVQDPTDGRYYQVGRKRVQGIELNAVGSINDHWSLSAGYTTMRAEVTRGTAVANDGSNELPYTPARAFTAWTSYRLPFGLTLGGGGRYAGRLKRGHDGAQGTPEATAGYWVFNAMASYPVNEHLALQLNLYNLFDRRYVAAINKSGYRYSPGTPRSATLTAQIRF